MSVSYVRVNVFVGDIPKRKVKEVTFLVNTGVFFPVIPLNLVKEFSIEPFNSKHLLVDGRKITVGIPLAYFKVLDREGVF